MPADLSVFQNAAPYRGFNEQDWKVLAGLFTEVLCAADDFVFREKDPGNGFYLIRSGKIRITRQVIPEGKNAPHEQLLTVLTSGQLFGEMALVDGADRSADATAEGNAVLYYLPQAEYEKLHQEHPGTALRIQDILVATLSSRIREANRSFEIIRFWCT